MTEDEVNIIKNLKYCCEFYSNKGKLDRERWTAREFLEKIGEKFKESQMENADEVGLGDIVYKKNNNETAFFEIKVIQSSYPTQNGQEVELTKEAFSRVSHVIKECERDNRFYQEELIAAMNQQFSGEMFDLRNHSGYELLVEKLSILNEKYSKRLNELKNFDLLVYCLQSRVTNILANEINQSDLKKYGWRSISYLTGSQALVLYASDLAPAFLKTHCLNGK